MDVRWSPNHEDKFFTFSSDLPRLALYKVTEVTDETVAQRDKKNRLSDRSYATPLSLNSDIPYKCVAWSPCQNPDHLIAVGHITGRVQLTSFGKGGTPDNQSLLGKELVPRHQRPCTVLEWNPTEPHLLAEVLEKYRQDYSVLVWDVQAGPGYEASSTIERKTSSAAIETLYSPRPYLELCQNEVVPSLAWFVNEPRLMVVGVGNKSLRIFDTRDITRPVSTSSTKSVFGITIDKHREHRLASFHENQIAIWDKRNFDKPVATLQESKPVTRLSWNPVRAGVLGCLVRDSSVVKVYELHQQLVGEGEVDLCFIDKVLKPTLQSDGSNALVPSNADVKLTSFDWHPTHDNRLIVVGDTGALADVHLCERAAICWSPDIYLTWTNGQQLNHFHSVKMCKESCDDIGQKMRRRSLKGYGISDKLNSVKKHIQGDGKLRRLWEWIIMIKKLEQAGMDGTYPETSAGFCLTHQDGILSLLQSASDQQSEVVFWPWHGLHGLQYTSTKRIYISDERMQALTLCEWTLVKDNTVMPLVDKRVQIYLSCFDVPLIANQLFSFLPLTNDSSRLTQIGEFERAAAIAVFSLKIMKAIEILQNASSLSAQLAQQGADVNPASQDLIVIAMALSGFTGFVSSSKDSLSKDSLWFEQCRTLSAKLANPYLRAMFLFLTGPDGDSYDSILSEPLELVDQVAFACLYLPDTKLLDYVSRKAAKCVEEGSVGAIFMTGISHDGIDMLQNYVDRTGDVQTAAIVSVHCVPEPEFSKEPHITSWIIAYQDLLDTWRLWNQRAEFDVFRCRMNRCAPPRPQIVVMCNFCAKSIGFDGISNLTLNRFMGGTTETAATPSPAPLSTKPRVSSCSQCRKPLPRCSVCLMRLGTTIGPTVPSRSKSLVATVGQKNTKVAEWMTWCQTCRHGGHASHLMEWFKDHKECPVSDCRCCCMSLDASASLSVESELLSTTPDKHVDHMASREDQSNAFKNVHAKLSSASASSELAVKMSAGSVDNKRSGQKKITTEL